MFVEAGVIAIQSVGTPLKEILTAVYVKLPVL